MAVHVAVAVSRPVSMRRRWKVDDLAMSHPSFCDNVVGEFLHIFTGTLSATVGRRSSGVTAEFWSATVRTRVGSTTC